MTPKAQIDLEEKSVSLGNDNVANPVLETAGFAFRKTNIVQINAQGVHHAAIYIHQKMLLESYSPRSWRTHALHICPPEPYDRGDPLTKTTLDWIFLISALNFSFWSEQESSSEVYGVEWREGWGKEGKKLYTGYWSLVAVLNRALEEGIPIIDPAFYSSEILCPDSLLTHIFRPSGSCREDIPLLIERMAIMREVGFVLCAMFGGSFQGLMDEFQWRYSGKGTALELVQMVVNAFPSFRDETWLEGQRVFLWKRAQILVAETWAAFYPPSQLLQHPFFPSSTVDELTMFADYRVPQILHHIRILTYPPSLERKLREHSNLEAEGREELSIRAASIVAVERIREEIVKLGGEGVNSVLVDFFLWDLAKRIEEGEEEVEGVGTAKIIPAHRTRSTRY